MPADLKYLRQHYASLSDAALLAVDRSDLVDAAQRCYDEELQRRNLKPGRRAAKHVEEPDDPELADSTEDIAYEDADSGQPDWLEDAAEVYSRVDRPGNTPGADIADARDALEAAGIPCFVDLAERPQEPSASSELTHVWRVLVPGNLNLRATSVLERDLFNQDFEETWKAHLETLSDAELRQMSPEIVFCGLFDRVERVTRAYEEELSRRRLKREA